MWPGSLPVGRLGLLRELLCSYPRWGGGDSYGTPTLGFRAGEVGTPTRYLLRIGLSASPIASEHNEWETPYATA